MICIINYFAFQSLYVLLDRSRSINCDPSSRAAIKTFSIPVYFFLFRPTPVITITYFIVGYRACPPPWRTADCSMLRGKFPRRAMAITIPRFLAVSNSALSCLKKFKGVSTFSKIKSNIELRKTDGENQISL